MTKNQVFESIITPTLSKIDYAVSSDLAEKWHLAPMVVLDPAICYGKPIVEPVGITTRVLAETFFGNNQDAAAVANWFEISVDHVNAAVAYECGTAA